ncbi:SiaC family regulatory phosphoprotein [Marinoscillum sp.]|uniref:SiaC family regulatory phosphoprotein n=1 Tax=Marinoscillum sp. TaxID=2024838 RepID=UPI003BAA6CC4
MILQTYNTKHINPWAGYLADEEIEPTATTPYVKFNRFANTLNIKGTSTRVEMDKFYASNVSKFMTNLRDKKYGMLNLNFKTFNTSTAKVLFDLFKFIREQKSAGAIVKIKWEIFATEMDMYDTAKDYAELFDLDIVIK